jgi:hypothetical protein
MVLAKKEKDQWNRIEDPDMNTCSYVHQAFDKGTKGIQWRKDSLINKDYWENWISAYRKLKLDLCHSPCMIINSKQIKDLNIRPEPLKLVQKRLGHTLELISISNDSLNRTQKVQQLRERIDK